MKTIHLAIVSMSLLYMSACGSASTSSHGSNTGKALKGLTSGANNTALASTLKASKTRAALVQAYADDRIAQSKQDFASLDLFTSCPSASEIGLSDCTVTCPTTSKLRIACINLDQSVACGSDTYTYSDASATILLDFSNVTASGSSFTGNYSITFDISTRVESTQYTGQLVCTSLAITSSVSSNSNPSCSGSCVFTPDSGELETIACDDIDDSYEEDC